VNDRILGPTSEINLTTILDRIKRETMYAINCVMIGTIESYNTLTNMASISINFKRAMSTGDVMDYPKLEDCPVFILSGSDASISMPIVKGDQCLVLFNDRNIDNWYIDGSVTTPADTRCHSIADGIVLVGIRSLKGAKLTPANSVCIDGGGSKVSIKNTDTNLKKIIDTLITTISMLAVPSGGGGFIDITGLTGSPTSVSAELAKLMDEGTS